MPDDVYFVKARMIRPNHPEVNKTFDAVNTTMAVLPVNNWISLAKSGSLRTKANMIKTAKARMDSVKNVVVKINGHETKPERIMSLFFNVRITQKNILYDFPQQLQLGKLEAGDYIALSDGYWLFLKMGMEKSYRIETLSSCATGLYTLAMDHELELVMSATSNGIGNMHSKDKT